MNTAGSTMHGGGSEGNSSLDIFEPNLLLDFTSGPLPPDPPQPVLVGNHSHTLLASLNRLKNEMKKRVRTQKGVRFSGGATTV